MTLVPLTRKSSSPVSARPARAILGSGFDDFDRVFDNFFRNALSNTVSHASPLAGASVTDMAVHMDISETEKTYEIKADLPGLSDEDIDLSVADGYLTLSGERSSETEEEGTKMHRLERRYGSFQRVLQLPADADEGKIKAHMKNGVLNIEIMKIKEKVKEPKKINITKS
jgi:HSP20 family protein